MIKLLKIYFSYFSISFSEEVVQCTFAIFKPYQFKYFSLEAGLKNLTTKIHAPPPTESGHF